MPSEPVLVTISGVVTMAQAEPSLTPLQSYSPSGAAMVTVAMGLVVVLLVSGVYYQVDVLPAWLQAVSHVSPATYILNGIRGAVIDGKSVFDVWRELAALAAFGVVLIPGGMAVFAIAERWARKTGRLKRQG